MEELLAGSVIVVPSSGNFALTPDIEFHATVDLVPSNIFGDYLSSLFVASKVFLGINFSQNHRSEFIGSFNTNIARNTID